MVNPAEAEARVVVTRMRAAMGAARGSLAICFWPAELKPNQDTHRTRVPSTCHSDRVE